MLSAPVGSSDDGYQTEMHHEAGWAEVGTDEIPRSNRERIRAPEAEAVRLIKTTRLKAA
jgi:hypothetical protein